MQTRPPCRAIAVCESVVLTCFHVLILSIAIRKLVIFHVIDIVNCSLAASHVNNECGGARHMKSRPTLTLAEATHLSREEGGGVVLPATSCGIL